MAGVKARIQARGKSTGQQKRIAQIERELLRPGSWPTGNPKAATARWQLVSELAHLRGVKVKVIKTWLEKTYEE
ncbi:hypothetical protein N9917_03255 [Deltaproteobacteria bacterium]|nr:hypothetical protein [Deltaproteobacteria bacterium]